MLAIENYGRRWRRDKIYWGKGKNKGHLYGELRRNRTVIIDFREQIGIYVLFGPNGNIVYVGQAGIGNARLFSRLKQHRSDHLKDRWTHSSWFGLRSYNQKNEKLTGHHRPESKIRNRIRKDALNETEAVLISVVEPILNKRGPNWTGSKEFFQHLDERLPAEVEDIVRRMEKRLDKFEMQTSG